jgi:hypothetical protein
VTGMGSIGVSSIVFACVFGGLLGMFIRALLPQHHLSAGTKDVVKLGMGIVATLSALRKDLAAPDLGRLPAARKFCSTKFWDSRQRMTGNACSRPGPIYHLGSRTNALVAVCAGRYFDFHAVARRPGFLAYHHLHQFRLVLKPRKQEADRKSSPLAG